MVRKTKGFTMVELITVAAIIAILATIALPVYNGMMPRYRLNGAARQVMGDLANARMNAVKLNTNVAVDFTGLYTYAFSGGSYNAAFDIRDQYPGVEFTAVPTDFTFTSRGTTQDGASHTATLKNSKNATRTITVNVAGQIKIN